MTISSVLRLPCLAMLLIAFGAQAQLKLTKDFSTDSQNVGETTLLGGAVANLPLTIGPRVSDNVLREVDFIVAVVNSEPVTRNEVLAKQARAYAQWAAQGVRPPPQTEVFKRVLDRLIEERALLQLAKETGIRISNDALNDALMGVARQHQLTSLPDLQTKYERDGGNWVSYREEIRNELTLIQLREREVEGRIRISDAEIEVALRDLQLSQTDAQDIHIAHILIALTDNASDDAVAAAKSKAAKILAQASAGEDFAKLALQQSDAPDKERGGSMGLRPAERYPALFAEAVAKLKVGGMSEPLRSGAGFHVLKLLERQQNNIATVRQSRVRHVLLPVSAQLTEAQAKARMNSFRAQIELNQSTFADIAKNHSTDSSAQQGGDLGWAGPGLFVPEFEQAVNALSIGQVSQPVVTRFGVHLIEVLERKEVPVSAREQKQQISGMLRERKALEAYTLWVADTRNRAFVEYRNQ